MSYSSSLLKLSAEAPGGGEVGRGLGWDAGSMARADSDRAAAPGVGGKAGAAQACWQRVSQKQGQAAGRATPPVRKACRRAASATAAPRGDSAPAAAAAAAVGVLAASGLPKPAWQLLQKCLPMPGRSLHRQVGWPHR